VTVRVLDKDRRPIRDLTEKDFTVLVEGTPRPIVVFAAEDAAGQFDRHDGSRPSIIAVHLLP
jgi:hypothetical protein